MHLSVPTGQHGVHLYCMYNLEQVYHFNTPGLLAYSFFFLSEPALKALALFSNREQVTASL